jgi:hypothetical protein
MRVIARSKAVAKHEVLKQTRSLGLLRCARNRLRNLYFRAFEIATAFEKGLAMTQRSNLYP